MSPLSEPLSRSPELFPQDFDPLAGSVSLIQLTETDFAKASFLDGRIVSPQTKVQKVSFGELQASVAEAQLPESCDFIFHIGHVGSTLLSRLLGAHPSIFALREPAPLRTLAQLKPLWSEAKFENHLSTFLKLWSRTFRPDQRTLLKATSLAAELAPEILARPSLPNAIFIFVSPEDFLASILGAENSPQEAQMMAPARAARLSKRLDTDIRADALSIGEMIAMGWACEMTALTAAPAARVLWINFERFLTNSAAALTTCLEHLGVVTTPEQIATIASGPDMRRYSKAQEFDYNAQLRADILANARARCGAEIKLGMNWLENSATKFSAIGAALQIK